MPVNNFDIETSSWEPIYDKNMIGGWEVDFSNVIKKLQERQKYDEVWQEIKEKNKW